MRLMRFFFFIHFNTNGDRYNIRHAIPADGCGRTRRRLSLHRNFYCLKRKLCFPIYDYLNSILENNLVQNIKINDILNVIYGDKNINILLSTFTLTKLG